MARKKEFMQPQKDHPEEESESKSKKGPSKEDDTSQIELWKGDESQRSLLEYHRTRDLLHNIN